MQTTEERPRKGGRPPLPRGPDGKPIRTADRSASQRLIDRNMPKITAVAIKTALAGDPQLLRVLVDRGIPSLRPVESPGVALPALAEAVDAVEGAKAVRKGVAEGRVSPVQAKELLAYLKLETEVVRLAGAAEKLAAMFEGQGRPIPADLRAILATAK